MKFDESIIGKKFGRITVIKRDSYRKGKTMLECLCDCGNLKIISRSDLVAGKTKSCGCLRKETAAHTGVLITKHGMSGTRLWTIWSSMIARCANKKHNAYQNYGERGIKVCAEWKNFLPFYDWAINNEYTDELTIDRIDNDGDYEPNNCRWATYKVQGNNRRNNHVINICGCKKTVSEWAGIVGINPATLSFRIKSGWAKSDLFIPADLNNKNIRKKEGKYA